MRATNDNRPRRTGGGAARAGRGWRGWRLAALGGLALAAGCAASNPYAAGTFARAEHFAARGKAREAVLAIDQFLRLNPADSLAARAQHLKALQYFKLKEYPLAAVELQILRREYPLSPYAPDALFLQAAAHFEQVGRLERDISHADSARTTLARFLALYPDSPRADEARAYQRRVSEYRIRKKLAEAKVYAQVDQPAAAGVALDIILAQESDSPLLAGVLLQRARYALDAKDRETAVAALNRLLASYPDAAAAADARRLLAQLGAPAP